MKRVHSQAGFSIMEIMVAVMLMAILSAVVIRSVNESNAQSRDAERQSDLRRLSAALELYRFDNGRYPPGCNAAGNWSGEDGTGFECSDGTNEYIRGLAPEYIPTLPRDPHNPNGGGYMYTISEANYGAPEGLVYKVLIKNTVESETVTNNHEFASCDTSSVNKSGGYCSDGSYGFTTPNECQSYHAQFRTSYAIWSGFDEAYGSAAVVARRSLEGTRNVYCKI